MEISTWNWNIVFTDRFVAAVKVDSIQTIPDYTDWDDLGYSNYTTNSNR